MTNQPTDNEWIEQARLTYNEIPIGGKECKDEETAFKQAILYNLPKPTEVVAGVDIEKIMKEIRSVAQGNPKTSGHKMLYLEQIENILQHLKGTTPVEPINQERTDSKVV